MLDTLVLQSIAIPMGDIVLPVPTDSGLWRSRMMEAGRPW